MKEPILESFAPKSEKKEDESRVEFREFIKDNSRKIANTLLFVSFLSIGDKIAQPLSAKENINDQSQEQIQEKNTVFQDISSKYQKIDIKDINAIKEQLDLYEKNKEILESLAGLDRAEYLHQLSYVQLAALVNELGLGDVDRVLYNKDSAAKDPEKTKQDIEKLRNIYFNLLEAATIRDISRDNYKDKQRTSRLKNEAFKMLVYLNADSIEASQAKEKTAQIIQNNYWRIKKFERNTSPSSPYFSIQLTIFIEEKLFTLPIDLYYNPIDGKVHISSGFDIFDEERTVIKEIRGLIEK